MVVGRVEWLVCSVWSEVMDLDEERKREVILERGKNKKNEEKKK